MGEGSLGILYKKIKSSVYFVKFFFSIRTFAPIYTVISWIIIVSLVKLLYFPLFLVLRGQRL